MKAKQVNEVQNFKRGENQHEQLGIGEFADPEYWPKMAVSKLAALGIEVDYQERTDFGYLISYTALSSDRDLLGITAWRLYFWYTPETKFWEINDLKTIKTKNMDEVLEYFIARLFGTTPKHFDKKIDKNIMRINQKINKLNNIAQNLQKIKAGI